MLARTCVTNPPIQVDNQFLWPAICDNHSGFLDGDNVDNLMVTVKRISLCLTVLDANHEVVVSFRVFFARALLPYNFTPSLQYEYF